MLILVGAGLDKGDLSFKAAEAIKSADKVFYERYTAPLSAEYIEWLKSKIGKEMVELARQDLEDKAKDLVAAAKEKNTVVIVPGDPLVATTHHMLIDIARANAIETRVIHSSSIFTAAIGESGLDIYRFGPTTTVAFWSEHYKPTSFLDVLKQNIQNNQHTMLLLDIEPVTKRPMELMEAAKLLVDAEDARHHNIINPQLMLIVIGNAGKSDQIVAYTSLENLKKLSEKTKGMFLTLIVPQSPNFAEKESMPHQSFQ